LQAHASQLAGLQAKGVDLEQLERCEPQHLLPALARRGCNQVLWECGPGLASVALQQGCVQEIAAVIAPKLLGGELARTPLGDLGFTAMDQVLSLNCEPGLSLGHDLLLKAQLSSCAAPN
jgi:diaminohydroxyphosphoribosylaminopyrimidine deaminase/5-amino-6-(5-phosphoribosylamino)uracil reductase